MPRPTKRTLAMRLYPRRLRQRCRGRHKRPPGTDSRPVGRIAHGAGAGSSVLIAAERQALPVSTLLEQLQRQHTATESRTGARDLSRPAAATGLQKKCLSGYGFRGHPRRIVYPRNRQIVAQIDAEARKNGIVIPFADLLIGGTALGLGYALVTSNLRHFQEIPGLTVIAF